MKQRHNWRDGILGESQLIPQIIYRLLSLYDGMSATWQQARGFVNHLIDLLRLLEEGKRD